MSTAGKSMMVVVGLFLFFGVAIVGPIAGNATGFAARTLLGQSEADNSRNQARALNPAYQAGAQTSKEGATLRDWADCCEKTGATWNYEADRWELAPQRQTAAFHQCKL